ncbi:histidine acid phosphatase [Niveomyces insectorum RCEF 264]|uniref:3-phytase n=1 Tax=Niveomyces insectorum RCEF 264 TaxID=1081102 RepID=A0A167Y2L3_9HYPO|nr:histidine acid phosphatase [Niveomyces insectorum RCEF 264]
MTSLVPRPPYSDDELRQLYPAGLELQLVQVLMRHGERTPVSPRFQNAGLHAFWPYCAAVKQLTAAVLADDKDPGVVGDGKGNGGGEAATKPLKTLAWRRRLETFGPDDAAVLATGRHGDLDAICDMGMLTDPGRVSTLRLGQRLRRLYVDRLQFLPQALGPGDADRLLYLRTTPIPRALESLQQAFLGLYPAAEASSPAAASTAASRAPVTIVSRAPPDETLFPNDGNCRRFAALSRAFAQRAAERWNDSDELAYVTKKIGPWLPPDRPRAAVDGKPRLSGVMDTINATLAHGPATRLPAPFYDARSRHIIEQVALEEWFAGYQESEEYRALGIGGLMGDLTARMVAQAEQQAATATATATATVGHEPNPNRFRFGLSGCHDTTLAAVLTSLGHKLPNWPPFTSHLAVELFHKQPPVAASATAATTTTTAPVSSSSSWTSFLPSIFGRSAATTASGIGRKPTPELTEGEKKKLAGYYVRIRYNDEIVTVPGCRPPGKHLEGDESFCTLEAFKAIVDKYTPRNWEQACRSNINAPAFPDQPQPSGF